MSDAPADEVRDAPDSIDPRALRRQRLDAYLLTLACPPLIALHVAGAWGETRSGHEAFVFDVRPMEQCLLAPFSLIAGIAAFVAMHSKAMEGAPRAVTFAGRVVAAVTIALPFVLFAHGALRD